MAFLWAVPPSVLVLGALAVCILARRAGELSTAVRASLDQLAEVQVAVAKVHDEAAATRAAMRHIEQR